MGRSSNLIGLSCWVYFDVRVHESMGHVSWNFSVCLSNGSKIDFFVFLVWLWFKEGSKEMKIRYRCF